MSTPVLDVRGLAFAYPDGHQALYGVDLHVHRGERVALLGPNGAGKTTLVLHLNGILVAGAGSVAVSGLPVTKANIPEIRRRVFTKFWKSGARGGSGLGMYLVHGLITAQGGTVEIADAATGGARIELTWPLATVANSVK